MKINTWFVTLALIQALTLVGGAYAGDDQPRPSIRTEPLTGFSEKSQAFGKLPQLGNYQEPSRALEISRPDTHQCIYDRVVRPFPALQVVDTMDRVTDLAGAAAGAAQASKSPVLAEPQPWGGRMRRPSSNPPAGSRGTPSTSGPLDNNRMAAAETVFGSYQGALRVRVLDDKNYAIFVFSPCQDSRGRYIDTDPMHPANWRLLSKNEAVDRLHSSMSYQTALHKAPDDTYTTLFEKTSGVTWKKQYASLNTNQGPKFSQVLRLSQDQQVAVKLPDRKEPVHTSVGAYLKGNLPASRQVTAAKPAAGFTNIGASSSGVGERLANVWYKEVQGASVDRTVQDTLKGAQQTRAREVSVVFNSAGQNAAREIQQGLEAKGLKVRMVPDEQHSKTTLVASGMGSGTKNPDKSSMVLWVSRSNAGGGSLPKDAIANQTGDASEGPTKMRGVAGAALRTLAPPLPAPPPPPPPFPTPPVRSQESKVAAPAPNPIPSPAPTVATGSAPSATAGRATPPVAPAAVGAAAYSPPVGRSAYNPPTYNPPAYSPPVCSGFSSGASSFQMPSFSPPAFRR